MLSLGLASPPPPHPQAGTRPSEPPTTHFVGTRLAVLARYISAGDASDRKPRTCAWVKASSVCGTHGTWSNTRGKSPRVPGLPVEIYFVLSLDVEEDAILLFIYTFMPESK